MANLLENLEGLYFDELSDLLDAGRQKAQAFVQMAAVASSNDLRTRLVAESDHTRAHLDHMRQVFGKARPQTTRRHCRGIEGLLRGGLDVVGMMVKPSLRDAGMILAAAKAQQYELAGIGTAGTLAELLGRDAEAQLLHRIGQQKQRGDEELTSVLRTVLQMSS